MATDTIIGINRHYAVIVNCAAVFTAGAVISLAVRVMSKVLTRAPMTWEDYTIFLATALFVVTEGLMIKGVTVGRHSKTLNDPDDMFLTKVVYIYSIFYFAIVALCIASILLLYRRVFKKPFVKHTTTALFVITVCWWIPCMIIETGFFGTQPETFHGAPANKTPFHVNYLNWWLSVGVIEQVIIVIAIFLPIREIYRLRLDLKRRLCIIFVFAISYVCVGTGIARLVTIYHPSDKFDISLGDIWVSAHLGTAIISANLPVCWPVFLRVRRILSMGRDYHDSHRDNQQHRDRADSVVGSPFGAATVVPTTKESDTRSEAMVQEMGFDLQRVPPSHSSFSSLLASQALTDSARSTSEAARSQARKTKGRQLHHLAGWSYDASVGG